MVTPSCVLKHFGSILHLIFCMIIAVWCQQENEVRSEYDICNPETHFINPSRVFLRGPSDSDKFGQSTIVYVNWTKPRQNPSQDFGCLMLFKTDLRSQIRVDAVDQNFRYPSCSSPKTFSPGQEEIDFCIPGCVYIKLVDSDYKEETTRLVTTASSLQTYPPYTSQSSKLHIIACDKGLDEIERPVNIRLRLSTVLKHRQIQGYVGVTTLSSQTLTSPYFPERYIQNLEKYTYSFSGIPGSGASIITVTFDDWDLSQFSKIVFKVDDTETYLSGLDSRPYFIADSPTMQMTFDTGQPLIGGGYSRFHGFKAVAKFYRNAEDVPRYLTDCDRTIDDGPGGIIIQNSFRDRRARDCIWIIKPSKDFSSVYLKVVSYTQGWGTWSSGRHENSLEVRGGVTSDAPQSMLLRPSSNMPLPDYGGQTSSKGFYIRFKGIYADGQSVVISYSQFRMECNPRYEYDIYFKCGNGRCIDKALRCDTYDHCGDNTDELYCNSDSVNEVNKHEGGHNYNYSISVGVIIPMVVVVFLIIVICLLVIFFKRFRRLRQSNANRGSVGSGLLGGGGRRDHREGERDSERGQRRGRDRRRRHRGNRSSHPGFFYPEYPPSYDEAMVSTPVDMLNMAFPWSQSDLAVGQPPSYEDAMLETSESSPDGYLAPPYNNSNSQQNNNNNMINNNNDNSTNNHNDTSRRPSRSGSVPSISTTTASGVYPGLHISRLVAGSTNDIMVEGQSRQRQRTSASSNLNSDIILDPNLAPGAYVSSSSSSEASETEMHMDMSSSSESSTDNEQGFIPNSSQATHLVQADDRQPLQQQQLLAHSSRRSSSASTLSGNPMIPTNNNENKVGQEDQNQPIVVKTKDTAPKESEHPSKKLKRIKEDRDGRGLLSEETHNITDGNDNFENSLHENEPSSRNNIDSYVAINDNESRSSEANGRAQQETKRRGTRKRRSRHRPRNSNKASNHNGMCDGSRGNSFEESQTHRRPLQAVSYDDIAEGNVDHASHAERRDLLRKKDVVKSHSCFNLNFGGDDGRFYPINGNLVSVQDKRYSYAGAGDASVQSQNHQLLQFPLSLQLARDRELESLDRYDSANYVSGNNTTRAEATQRQGAISQGSLDSILEVERTGVHPSHTRSSEVLNKISPTDVLQSPNSNSQTTRDCSDKSMLNVNRLERMNVQKKGNRDVLPSSHDALDRRHTGVQQTPERESPDSVSRYRQEPSHGSLLSDRKDCTVKEEIMTHNPVRTANTIHSNQSLSTTVESHLLYQNNGIKHPPAARQVADNQHLKGQRRDELTNLDAKRRRRSQVPPAMSSTEIANIYAKRQSLESIEERLSSEKPGRPNRQKSDQDGRRQNISQLCPAIQSYKSGDQLQKEDCNLLQMPYQSPSFSNDKNGHLQLSASPAKNFNMPQQKREFSKASDNYFSRPYRDGAASTSHGVMRDTPITFNVAAGKVVCDDEHAPAISLAEAAGFVPGIKHVQGIPREEPDKHVSSNPPQNYNMLGSSRNVDGNQFEDPGTSLYKAKAKTQGSHHTRPLLGNAIKKHPGMSIDRSTGQRLDSQKDRFVHHPKQRVSQPPKSPRGRQERQAESQPKSQFELSARDDSITSCHMDMYRPGHGMPRSRPVTNQSTASPTRTDVNHPHASVPVASAPYHQQLRAENEQGLVSAEQNRNFPINYLSLQDNDEELDIYV